MAPTPINKRVQMPRNTTKILEEYTGPNGQIVVDVERRALRLHDGKKKGGWEFPNLSSLSKLFLGKDSELGSLVFPEEITGFIMRTADKIYQVRELSGADGIEIDNPAGIAGDPTVGLPDRLKPEQAPILDANLATLTGFYIVQHGADSNLPAAFVSTTDAALMVHNYISTSGGSIYQIARAAQITSTESFARRFINDAWTEWVRVDSMAEGEEVGTLEELIAGIGEKPKLWTAQEISEMIRVHGLQAIQTIEGSTAKAYSYNQLFRIMGSGASTTTSVQGPTTFATNDRIEIVASATAVKSPAGDSQIARVEIERTDGNWDTLAQATVAILANEETKSIAVMGRFIKTATGYQTADESWAVVSTVAATLSGRVRVTVGTTGNAGARAARFR
jgi:hypothetical protein